MDSKKIKLNTHWSRQYAEDLRKRLKEHDEDIKKEYRLKQHECKTCFYLKGSIAGAAFTRFNCKECGEEVMHPNTNVPHYCDKCAEKFGICIRCGAEINS